MVSSTDIYSNGIDYINQSVPSRVAQEKKIIQQNLHLLDSHRDIILAVCEEAFEQLELSLSLIEGFSKGEDVKRRQSYWTHRERLSSGLLKVKLLKVPAPKTYQFFKQIEDKIIQFNQALQTAIIQAEKHRLVFGDIQKILSFKSSIDQLAHKVNQEAYLVKVIVHLNALVDAVFKPFQNLASDYSLQNHPELWVEKWVNGSAAGFANYDQRAYPLLSWVDIKVDLKNLGEVATFEAKVVKTQYDKKHRQNFTAFEFYFPRAIWQKQLLAYLQITEVTQASRVVRSRHARN